MNCERCNRLIQQREAIAPQQSIDVERSPLLMTVKQGEIAILLGNIRLLKLSADDTQQGSEDLKAKDGSQCRCESGITFNISRIGDDLNNG
jgi:hypothetical protein